MKLKIVLIMLFFASFATVAMEKKDIDLKQMLVEVPSLKFLAAWQFASCDQAATIKEMPQEVLELVNKIKNLKKCRKCSNEEKKLLINLINNPDFPYDKIVKYFPKVIEKYSTRMAILHAYMKEQWGPTKTFENKRLLINAMLSQALYDNYAPLIEILIDDADSNTKSSCRKPVLQWAIQNNKKEIVQRLLDRGVDVNAKNIGDDTALMIAILYYDQKDTVKKLLAAGADVNAQNGSGMTGLMFAAGRGYKEIVQMLLDKGADVNIQAGDGWSALMWAARNNKKEIVQILLDKGADFNIKNNKGRTALELAVKNKHENIAQMLKEAEAEKSEQL